MHLGDFLHSEALSNRDKNSRKAVHKNQSYSSDMSGELLEAASNMEGDGSITELSAQGITDIAVMMLPEKYQVCMMVNLLCEQKGNHDICSLAGGNLLRGEQSFPTRRS